MKEILINFFALVGVMVLVILAVFGFRSVIKNPVVPNPIPVQVESSFRPTPVPAWTIESLSYPTSAPVPVPAVQEVPVTSTPGPTLNEYMGNPEGSNPFAGSLTLQP